MQKGFKGILLVPFFIFISVAVLGQSSTVSPYSKIGVGDLYPNSYSAAQGYAGANHGLHDKININFNNPASYSALELTTFEIGFQANNVQFEQSNPSIFQKNGSAGLRYFVFGLPLKDWWGAAIGIQPYSLKGYSISSDSSINNVGFQRRTDGSGGLNQFFLGNSFEVAKGLSLGINSSFIFGKVEESQYVVWDNTNFLNTKIQDVANIKGFYFTFGAQYQHDLGNGLDLGLGATLSTSSKLDAAVGNFAYTFIGTPGSENPVDSTAASTSIDSEITLPSELGFGFSIGKRKGNLYNGNYAWAVNGDFQLYNGEEFLNYDGTNTNLTNGYRAELGGYVIPTEAFANLNRRSNFWTRIQYRVGGFYEKTPLVVNGTDINNYGMTFGLGIPVIVSKAPGEVKVNTINTGLVLGRRGTTDNGLIRETYLNLYIGVTLNDKWFIKYKYR